MKTAHPDIEYSDDPESEIFATFFDAYDRAFVLPDEKETRGGLADCLRLNHGATNRALVARYGHFRELCAVAREPGSGRLIGGANFIAMPHFRAAGESVITANLNYIFIDPEQRHQGWLRPVLSAMQLSIAQLFSEAGNSRNSDVLLFIEQNDPLLLSGEAYERDSKSAGIDQFDRLRIWSRLGALMLDFPYVQPPLSANQEPDAGLIYSVLGSTAATIDAQLLCEHLRTFFGVSVLKGEIMETVPTALEQIRLLENKARSGDRVDLLDPRKGLSALDRQTEANLMRSYQQPFRNWIRQFNDREGSPGSVV